MLLLALGMILAAAELFTNAIEWLGDKLNLSHGVVGSILASVGTALPETMIPIIAFIAAAKAADPHAGQDIGIGAVIGAPFMLGTLAMAVTGIACWAYARMGLRDAELRPNIQVAKRDLRYFLIVFPLALLASLLPQAAKPVVGVVLIGLYLAYVWQTIKAENGADDGGDHDALKPLIFAPGRTDGPGWFILSTQLVASLSLLIGGAHLFVVHVTHVASFFGVPPLILALVLAPIATELPEKFNSVVWIRARKDTLALGNITGAMVFQSSIPPAFGLFMSPWTLSRPPVVSSVLAIASTLLIVWSIHRHNALKLRFLLAGGGFYVAFIVAVIFFLR
ncbi:MAG: sodium:calcium antiporter [Candidatus Sericytochromatia bacterium]|nr:sodium:calcium antiporter [Candidatus Sericytochromatia bacterium]